jgi:hypothetical protein
LSGLANNPNSVHNHFNSPVNKMLWHPPMAAAASTLSRPSFQQSGEPRDRCRPPTAAAASGPPAPQLICQFLASHHSSTPQRVFTQAHWNLLTSRFSDRESTRYSPGLEADGIRPTVSASHHSSAADDTVT